MSHQNQSGGALNIYMAKLFYYIPVLPKMQSLGPGVPGSVLVFLFCFVLFFFTTNSVVQEGTEPGCISKSLDILIVSPQYCFCG